MIRFGATTVARYHSKSSRSIILQCRPYSQLLQISTSTSTTKTNTQNKWRGVVGNGSAIRNFSTTNQPPIDNENETHAKKDKEANEEDTQQNTKTQTELDEESFRDTIHRLKNDQEEGSTTSTSTDTASSYLNTFLTNLSETWDELLNSSKPRDINKKLSDIHGSKPGNRDDDDDEAAEKYKGTMAVMVIDEEENLNAFERIQKRLSEAPIIQEIYSKSGAAQAREKLSHMSEDAREAWETSQNPWVYRASSVYDTLTAESEHGMTERELRELDPEFSLESWKNDVAEITLPKLMRLFLEGRIKELKPYLGESVYNRMAAESRVRKKEGVYVDTNVLGIMNTEILDCKPDMSKHGGESPTIVLHFMCQQINCVRTKETGEVVEGSEDDIRAYSYICAFQRSFDEAKGELNWKVVDFMPNGAIAYL